MKQVVSWLLNAYSAASPRAPRGRIQKLSEAFIGRVPIPGVVACSSAEYAARSATAKWHKARSTAACNYEPPTILGQTSVTFSEDLATALPELGVIELRHAFVLSPNGWILTDDGELLMQHSYHNRPGDVYERPLWSGRVRHLKGTTVVLASDWSGVNYCHLLLDGLGRIGLLDEANVPWRDADYFLIPHAKLGILDTYLTRLGIPRERCIELINGTAYRADRLLAPTFPGLRRNYSDVVRSLQELIKTTDRGVPSRVLLARSGPRQIKNEDRIFAFLQRFGFAYYDPAVSTSQPEDFARFDIVIAVHGAALANLVFCRPGTLVVELFASNYTPSYYFTLSKAIGLRYVCMAGTPSASEDAAGDLYANLEIDLEVFQVEVENLLTGCEKF